MRNPISTAVALSILTAAGCAPLVPRELADARTAYQHASTSRAADLRPADLHQAKEALDKAELAFKDEPKTQRTRDLSYVAQRKAQLSEVLAGSELASQQKTAAGQSANRSEQAIQKRTQGELSETRDQLAEANRQGNAQNLALLDSHVRTAEAEAHARSAQDALAKLAMVNHEARGMVITLSGSVLFASNQATLLPEAEAKLSQVSDALMSTKERTVIVEGHTDSRGSASHNMDLSQRRAEAVRSFMVLRGYQSDRMQARGIGKDRPATSNASAEGRANNRRVEIIIQPAKN